MFRNRFKKRAQFCEENLKTFLRDKRGKKTLYYLGKITNHKDTESPQVNEYIQLKTKKFFPRNQQVDTQLHSQKKVYLKFHWKSITLARTQKRTAHFVAKSVKKQALPCL